MTTNNKTVYLLICSKSTLPVHGGAQVDVTTAFEVVGEWDSEYKEYFTQLVKCYYYVGKFDSKAISPREFELNNLKYKRDIPKIGDNITSDDILWSFHEELNTATPTNPDASRYAETVFKFWRGELKYNTVTITEAV